MNDEIKLNDIADELLILNKLTIDTLFKLDNCADCIALYVFYYKTAKWQKTNQIKANDVYVKKSLKWGDNRLKSAKAILKLNGLIEIIQRRNNGKIEGWYVKVAYIVTEKIQEDIKIKVESKNTPNQQLDESRSGFEEINALKEYIKCLKKEIEVLKAKKENTSFDKMFDDYTDDEEIKDLLKEWLKVRKAKRSALTNKAIELNLNKLDTLAEESGCDIKTYLEEIISLGWGSFFKLNNYSKNNKKEENEITLKKVGEGAFQL